MDMSSRTINRRSFTAAAGAGVAALAVGAVPALAQEASPAPAGGPPGLPPLPEGATIVVSGLYNPRYIDFSDDGTMYITEVGVGGDLPFVFGPPPAEGTPEGGGQATPVTDEATPAAEEAAPPSNRGYTGQITQVTPDGVQTVIATGLASYSDGVGAQGIAVVDGLVYFTIGGTAVLAGVEPLEGENSLNRLDPATGEITQIVEFNTYEIENNSDGADVNPNVYAITAGDPDGRLTINDAGANVIYSVDPETGEFTVKGVVPDLNALTANSDAPVTAEPARQPVPTDGASNAAGAYFVALLSEGWPENGPSVLRVDGDGDFATFTGITNARSYVTGLTFGPDGQLYLSQLFDDPAGPPVGTIFRVNVGDGTAEPVRPDCPNRLPRDGRRCGCRCGSQKAVRCVE